MTVSGGELSEHGLDLARPWLRELESVEHVCSEPPSSGQGALLGI